MFIMKSKVREDELVLELMSRIVIRMNNARREGAWDIFYKYDNELKTLRKHYEMLVMPQ